MSKLKISCATVVLSALFVAGCGGDKAEDSTAALTVNGAVLTNASLDKDVESLINAQKDSIPTNQLEYARKMFRNNLAQNFIVENVLVAKAEKAGVTVTDEDFKQREADFIKAVANQPDAPKSIEEAASKSPLGKDRAMKEFKNGILIEKYLKQIQATAPAEDFTAKANEIIKGIIENNKKAEGAEKGAIDKLNAFKAELDKITDAKAKAEKFAQLAKENSDCPSKEKGGDLDFFTHGMMVKEFDEVAFKLAKGEISAPVKTDFGYHLIMTTDKTAAVEANGDKPATPEKVRASHILIRIDRKQDVPEADTVISMLKKNAERQFTMKFITDAIREAKIEAADEFKSLLPPPEMPEVPAQAEIEKTADK